MWAMPIITINLGGEMIYILHQRLRAQKVPLDKESKVLREVITAMYSSDFIEQLFKPQPMYTLASTRQIFDKLAHSSLMRLNKTSMDKLYDLMIMSFKHQMVHTPHVYSALHVSMLHLQAMRSIVGTEPSQASLRELLDATENQFMSLYRPGGACGSEGQLMALRVSLLRFVQDRKVKASLFLQKNIQGNDGMFILSVKGALPYGVEVPGAAYQLSGRSRREYRLSETPFTALAVHPSAGPWDPAFAHGTNLYTMDSSVLCTANSDEDKVAIDECITRLQTICRGVGGCCAPTSGTDSRWQVAGRNSGFASITSPSGKKMSSDAAKAERDLNQSMLGGGAKSSGGARSTEGMSLSSLLSGHASSSGGAGGFIDLDVPEDMVHSLVDARAGAKTMDSMLAELDLKDSHSSIRKPSGAAAAQSKSSGGSSSSGRQQQKDVEEDGEDDEDDLLALMDMADAK